MKVLLYCTKAKPYLYRQDDDIFKLENKLIYEDISEYKKYYGLNNGKIVAECDFEVEGMEDYFNNHSVEQFNKDSQLYLPDFISYITKGGHHINDLAKYVKKNGNLGYAIHIKNLHIFDEPRELSDYYKYINKPIINAPQNMMKAFGIKEYSRRYVENGYVYEVRGDDITDYILISIRPEWLCKILNGEKTIECRKRILKEMIQK